MNVTDYILQTVILISTLSSIKPPHMTYNGSHDSQLFYESLMIAEDVFSMFPRKNTTSTNMMSYVFCQVKLFLIYILIFFHMFQ